jgi:hypothetical protein
VPNFLMNVRGIQISMLLYKSVVWQRKRVSYHDLMIRDLYFVTQIIHIESG